MFLPNGETEVLYPPQYRQIFRVSFVSLISVAWAIYNGHYVIAAVVPGGVFLTSVNYWRKPTATSMRRIIDINYVRFATFFQLAWFYKSHNISLYVFFLFTAIAFYQYGWYLYKRQKYWASTHAHCMLHIMANIGNIVLYRK